MRCSWLLLLALLGSGMTSPASAQDASLELSFTPTHRAQIAVWAEREDGLFMGTFALTYAVAKMGIGNRPGALQFNSGFRYPYGRREGVLPVWAHRRSAAPDAMQWKRVIFQNRISEGHASRSSDDMSPDHYYCLSFTREISGREALDAVTCASVFSSDKGRYINDTDVANGYAEPYEDAPGRGRMRNLSLTSLYPPRRDVERCTQENCFDHPDIASFREHASEVMPEIDAITRATLQGERPAHWLFSLPATFRAGERYKLFVEVNVEGDYNARYSDKSYPTPRTPHGSWDSPWALDFGYPYRGQPSVVYELPFTVDSTSTSRAVSPVGFGALHGEDGSLTPLDDSISDDPVAKKGSGADRLLLQNGVRLSLRVLTRDAAACAETEAPAAVAELKVDRYPEKRSAHMWASLSFKAPASQRPIGAYVVEVKTDDTDWEQAFTPDSEQVLLPVALDMCADPNDPARNRCHDMSPGTTLEATLAGLRQSTHYMVRVTARDRDCGDVGASASTEFTTPAQTFATVSPCFVASAAYGSPLAAEIHVLRALRDRQLRNHALGRALVDLYYELGPQLAEPVQKSAWLSGLVRSLLTPIVHLGRWLTEE